MSDLLADLSHALPSEYVLLGRLGSGGQGTVFHAQLDGQEVALKLFGIGTDERRVDRELALLRAIDCPYLAKVVADGRIALAGIQTRIVAYEYLPGGSLRSACATETPQLTANQLMLVFAQCAIAIESLWAKRVVHRDVKPDNIVCADSDRYVLVDLGLARHLDRSNLTAPGAAPGTEGYKSPEQALGRRNLTIHSDVFSLGVTLYELASKRHPFNRTQSQVGNLVVVPLKNHRPDLPESLCLAIHRMMSIPPSNRPNHPTDIIRAIPGGSDVLP